MTIESRSRSSEVSAPATAESPDPAASLRPRASRLGTDPVATLSAARIRVLELLDEADGPTTITTLSQRSGYHPNTLREHLNALIGSGLVCSTSGAVNGRGRPPLLYQPVAAEGVRPQLRAYASLALALAHHLASISDDPAETARAAGVEWGRAIARNGELAGDPGRGTHERTVKLLTHLGFCPTTSGSLIRLGVCPFLAAATSVPTVVCNVHLGLLQGYTEAMGGDASEPVLRPYSAEHGCEVSTGE